MPGHRRFVVAPDNAATAEQWDGDKGGNWVQYEDRYEAAHRGFLPALFEAAAIGATDRVLDVGCGCGATTRQAARAASSGHALGLDLSSPMLERARECARLEGLENVRLVRGDAQVFPFERASFDVVISRFGVMFFGDPVAAFSNVASSLRPGGGLAWLCWPPVPETGWAAAIIDALRAGRDLTRPTDGPGPFSLADPTRTERLLSEAGLADIKIRRVNTTFHAGPSVEAAFEFISVMGIARELLEGLDDAGRSAAEDELRRMLATRQSAGGIRMASAAWLVTARQPR